MDGPKSMESWGPVTGWFRASSSGASPGAPQDPSLGLQVCAAVCSSAGVGQGWTQGRCGSPASPLRQPRPRLGVPGPDDLWALRGSLGLRVGWFPGWPSLIPVRPLPRARHRQRLCVPRHHPHHCTHGPPAHGGVPPAAGGEGSGGVPGAPRGPVGDRTQPGRVSQRLWREPRGGRCLPGHPLTVGGRGPRLGCSQG